MRHAKGAGSLSDQAPFLFPTSHRRSRSGRGDQRRCARRRRASSGPAGYGAATTASGGGLQLARFARLRVVALATQVGKDARLLDLLLEGLERPVEAIIVAYLNLDQSPLLSFALCCAPERR